MTPPGWDAIVSMLGNPEAFKMFTCVCASVFDLFLMCAVCTHVFTYSEDQYALYFLFFVCTVSPVSHRVYKVSISTTQ